MGLGLLMDCPKCKKQYCIHLGRGMMSFADNSKFLLYYCPKCGNWENRKIGLSKIPTSLEELSKEVNRKLELLSRIDFSLEDLMKQKEKRVFVTCIKCKARMKTIENIKLEKMPPIVCFRCHSQLMLNTTYCWD